MLEPSPPAVTEEPWFADDPVAPELRHADRPLLAPVASPQTDRTWDDLCAEEPHLAGWCADRWLGAWRRLPPVPSSGVEATRLAWHTLAEHVLASARQAACGRIGLRFTRGGFGTPFFGADRQLRVDADGLVVDQAGGAGSDGGEQRFGITTVNDMAARAGIEPGAPTDVFQPTTALRPDAPLTVEPAAAHLLGEWFGFAASVLEQLRADADRTAEPSRVQLWPEHFDLAVEMGREADGRRAGYGASPGDALHPEPYLYVVPWGTVPVDSLFADPHFAGASLTYAELSVVEDQRHAALAFFRAASALIDSNRTSP